MAKTDLILKKAAFFEKLALYGDKKSFLKAMGQGAIFEFQKAKGEYDVAIKQLNQAAAVLGRSAFFDKDTDVSVALKELEEIRNELNSKTQTMDPGEWKRARNYYFNALTGVRKYADFIKSYRMNQKPIVDQDILEPTYETMKGRNPDLFTMPEESVPSSKTALFDYYFAQLETAISKPDMTAIAKYERLLQREIEKSLVSGAVSSERVNAAYDLIQQGHELLGV